MSMAGIHQDRDVLPAVTATLRLHTFESFVHSPPVKRHPLHSHWNKIGPWFFTGGTLRNHTRW